MKFTIDEHPVLAPTPWINLGYISCPIIVPDYSGFDDGQGVLLAATLKDYTGILTFRATDINRKALDILINGLMSRRRKRLSRMHTNYHRRRK